MEEDQQHAILFLKIENIYTPTAKLTKKNEQF